MQQLRKQDPDLFNLIKQEESRQLTQINLIPSENYASSAVRQAVGSGLANKYSEGNIGKRYYEGNEYIDEIEKLAIDRARILFKLPEHWGVNVQALSGSNANLAVYTAMLEQGDTMLGMYLPDGGHLSHGWSFSKETDPERNKFVYMGGKKKIHITSKLFNTIQYKIDRDTELLDYEVLEQIAMSYRPKMIITGGTAYPRDIDYLRVREIADKAGAFYHADIAHEAGLVAAGLINSPIGVADVVTMTTHKTLRSARGALIFADREIIRKVDRSVLPGLQGGPFNNNIAGIAAGLSEALQPEFKEYARAIIANAKSLEKALKSEGFRLVSDGGDKHLLLVDLREEEIYGKYCARALARAGIILNMNTIPGEKRSPVNPSGIRLGTPFVTTLGMGENEMKFIATKIRETINIAKSYKNLKFLEFENEINGNPLIGEIADQVKDICADFQPEI